MCVQFTITKSTEDLTEIYHAQSIQTLVWKPHIFPKYPSPVVIEKKGAREIVLMNYGLIPFFEKNANPKMVFHNARFETLKEKTSFKKSYLEQRCLIPIDSFLEYVDSDEMNPKTKKPKKKLLQFVASDHAPLVAAGIWSYWKNPLDGSTSANFSMITCEPPSFIEKAGHDRCPLFLKSESSLRWLSADLNSYELLDQFLIDNRAVVNWAIA